MSDEMPWSELAHDERFGPGRLVDGRYVIMRELCVPPALGRLFQCSTLPLGRQVLLSLAPSAELAVATAQQRRPVRSRLLGPRCRSRRLVPALPARPSRRGSYC